MNVRDSSELTTLRGERRQRGRRSLLVLVLSALVSLAALAAPALGDVQTIDFESGALNAPMDSQGDIGFPLGLGFRPYRVDVGAARAHSGSRVGDLTRCAEEQEARGGNPGECEFFQAQTTVQLARAAKLVRVFAGRFGPVEPNGGSERAILTAFDVQGRVLASTPAVPIDTSFDTPLEVQSPGGRIVSFRIEATGPDGGTAAGDLGIDDLSVQFVEGALPDFSITAPNQVLPIVQGQQVEVPIQIQRLNGSTGPLQLSLSGLPEGVSADPVTVETGQSTAILTMHADPNAPDTDFQTTNVTVTATPLAQTVGPEPRTTSFLARVATDFVLGADGVSAPALPAGEKVPISVPDCAAVDIPVTISRDLALGQDVSLTLAPAGSATALPQGVTAEFLPSPVVPPGGNAVAARTLRIRADWHAIGSPYTLPVILEGAIPGSNSTHGLPLELVRTPEASVTGATLGLETPRFRRPGSMVRVHGNGFCARTRVEVGNEEATAPATLIDEHTIEFEVPRLATNGAVKVDPPEGLSGYGTTNQLTIDSFRNSAGFPFSNYGGGALTFSEFREAFGDDDLFVKVNPCWPFDCTISTGLPDPVATIEWGVFDQLIQAGRCFGMGLTSQELRSGKLPYARFYASGSRAAKQVFDLRGASAPSADLASHIDAAQVRQYSDQFLRAYGSRKRGVLDQLQTLEAEFAHNRTPLVEIANQGLDDGHALVAYDLTQTATTADIYVYDPNRPFQPGVEEADLSAALLHKLVTNESVIHVNKELRSWSFSFDKGSVPWTGGNDGSLWVVPAGAMPDDPSLPNADTARSLLRSVIFASSPGAVRSASRSAGAEELGAEPAAPGAGSAGGVWTAAPGRSLDVTFEGRRSGHYTQLYSGDGFVAGAGNVATAKGVTDRIVGAADAMTFASGEDRSLQLKLARRSGPALTSAATVQASASAGGQDTVGLSGEGSLTYSHDGDPTKVSFTLSEIRRDGGPQTFVSPPIELRGGERLRATPVDRGLNRVLVSVRGPGGSRLTRVLRNGAIAHRYLRIGAPRVSGDRIAVGLRLSGFHGRAIAGVVLRLVRGGHVVARRAVSLRTAGKRTRVLWRLPRRLSRGNYRLLSYARAIGGGGRGFTATASASATRAASVRLTR